MKGSKKMHNADVVPLRAKQARVEAGRDVETNADVWLVIATLDGAEIVMSDHPNEHEAVKASLDCW
jgi:hypothetical protein